MTTDLAALLLRLVVGAIFLAQGHRKILAPAGAPHGRRALIATIEGRGFPAAAQLAALVGMCELVGGALVITGFLTRLAVVPLIITLIIAAVRFKSDAGFVSGWDWPFSVLGSTAALLLLGGGAYSLDALLRIPI